MKTFFSFIPAVFLPALLFLSGAYFLCRLCRYFLPGRLFPALRRAFGGRPRRAFLDGGRGISGHVS